MADMFLERAFEPPITEEEVIAMTKDAAWCLETHGVVWHGSLLSLDGQSMLCRFSAADADSVRLALRQARIDSARLWSGAVYDAAEPRDANVLVERSFEAPVLLEDIQAIEDRHQWCLDTYDVKFVRTFFSEDRKRMICLYAGPDAESVRAAQREAGMALDRVWAFKRIGPEHLSD